MLKLPRRIHLIDSQRHQPHGLPPESGDVVEAKGQAIV